MMEKQTIVVKVGTSSLSILRYRLKEKLDEIKDDYSYIIIDCPPSLGLITLNAFSLFR